MFLVAVGKQLTWHIEITPCKIRGEWMNFEVNVNIKIDVYKISHRI